MRQVRPHIHRLQAKPVNHLSGDLGALYRGRYGAVRPLDRTSLFDGSVKGPVPGRNGAKKVLVLYAFDD